MGISPMYTSQTSPAWTPTITDDSGAAVNLTGGTIALSIYNIATQQSVAGAGTFTITDALNGKAKYQWAAADTATPGSYLLKVTITGLPGGQLEADPVPWEVLPA